MLCCAVYSKKQNEILHFQACHSLEEKEQERNLNDILLYVNDFKFLKPKQVQKIYTWNGIWYLELDEKFCCHLVYCQKNYPAQSSLRFLSQMKKLVCQLNQYDSPDNITKFLSNRIFNLIKGYDADISYDDADFNYADGKKEQLSEKSTHSIIVDLPENYQGAGDQRLRKGQTLRDSKSSIQNNNFYPRPTTSIQFNEYLCYGAMILVALLMLILIIIKI
ncbi:transmembrane protein, putative (macronuclear) [Tetrahymena thermophila SB210]|uniref:Transmembrane protein, putative n=1 Tax=Tetrahymena thermophila (strain SB210) TaxID=312017 RepID=Q22MY0_TETTS|nr:transmembrane protein, putative [Tetrahymena thermophila SB210]EAR86428.1 transmembrane protein, putative [Tetrahymena thermophila SB210]|eukprot:XP_976890.1 transmembrane protein, putative [Tetrahymena thermophila SB210]